jgi:hypothetical protein
MPRPGFYNDNEYRAYPFVYSAGAAETLPNSLIVDVGIIAGLDAQFDAGQHSVWLHSLQRDGDTITFAFATDAPGAAGNLLTFSRAVSAERWELEYAEAASNGDCAPAPTWEGFLVTGDVAAFAENFENGDSVTFTAADHQLEPARVQNLAKSYLNSINVGNYTRTTVPECGTTNDPARPIVLNTRCVTGDIRFMAGYQCSLAQIDRVNEINISGSKTDGLAIDAGFCAAGSEVPLFAGEPLAPGSQFYSGGPACNELISSINGLEGSNINLSAGAGVRITTSGNKITVAQNTSAQNNCATNGG